MNFELTDRQKAIQAKAKTFAADVVKPRLGEMEQEDRFPNAIRDGMTEHGLWGLPYDGEYRGGGYGYVGYALAMEEISKQSVAVGATLSVHTLAAAAIFHYGTEEQKRKYLPAC